MTSPTALVLGDVDVLGTANSLDGGVGVRSNDNANGGGRDVLGDVNDAGEHRSTGQVVQDFGGGRPHSRTIAGSEDDHRTGLGGVRHGSARVRMMRK